MREKPKYVPIPVIVWVRMSDDEKLEASRRVADTDEKYQYAIDMMKKYSIFK
jgi:hypothetical protein